MLILPETYFPRKRTRRLQPLVYCGDCSRCYCMVTWYEVKKRVSNQAARTNWIVLPFCRMLLSFRSRYRVR